MSDKKSPSYLQVKVNGKLMGKHRYIYEQVHGEIPEGHVICFLDGDNRNFDIDNLYAIPKRTIGTTNLKESYKRTKGDTAEDFKKKLEKVETRSKEIDEFEAIFEDKGGHKTDRRSFAYSRMPCIRKEKRLYFAEKMKDPEYYKKKKEYMKEYQVKYREKIRNNPEYREKERGRGRVYRAKKKNDPEWHAERAKQARLRYAKKKALREAKI